MNTIKLNATRILALFLALSIFSCAENTDDIIMDDPEEIEDGGNTNSPFDLEGMINGVPFTTREAKVEIAPDADFDRNTTEDLFFRLFDRFSPDGVCQTDFRIGPRITFRPPYEVGKFDLFKEEDTYYNLPVSFNDGTAGGSYNAYEGYIEILSIDSEKVTGKIDATFSSNTYLRGSFEVRFCPE